MNYYVWNGKDPIMGLSAQTLTASRPDFLHDAVIVIHKNEDKNNVVMIETMEGLREAYDIDSTDPMVVGFVVSVILAQDEYMTIKDQLRELDEKNAEEAEEEDDDDVISAYAEMLEDLIKQEIEKEFEDPFIPLAGDYMDPECRIIDLSDVPDNIPEKRMTLVLKHAFVENIEESKFMDTFNERMKELEEKREKYIQEANLEAAELTTHHIETMKSEIEDPCDAILKIDVDKVHQYSNGVIIDCSNGQTMIIDPLVLESLRTSALEYEKADGENAKHKVHYKTVDVVLNSYYNEVVERGNTIFVISV